MHVFVADASNLDAVVVGKVDILGVEHIHEYFGSIGNRLVVGK
jgi:hypothetical protein